MNCILFRFVVWPWLKKKVNCRFFILFLVLFFVVVVDLAQAVRIMVLSLAALSGCSARIPVYTAQGPG